MALVTAEMTAGGTTDTPFLLEAFQEMGASADLRIWTDSAVRWETYDRVLLHCPWDYSLRYNQFSAWLDDLPKGVLVNGQHVRNNLDKRYLLALAELGVALPTTAAWTVGDASARRDTVCRDMSSGKVIVKPMIGAGGRQVRIHENVSAALAYLEREKAGSAWLVQSFDERVIRYGETSAVFIGGRIRYGITKRASAGSFLVQERHGGRATLERLTGEGERFANHVLGTLLDGEPSYARVDFVHGDGRPPVLMELEMVEPDLFLRFDSSGAFRLAQAIIG